MQVFRAKAKIWITVRSWYQLTIRIEGLEALLLGVHLRRDVLVPRHQPFSAGHIRAQLWRRYLREGLVSPSPALLLPD